MITRGHFPWYRFDKARQGHHGRIDGRAYRIRRIAKGTFVCWRKTMVFTMENHDTWGKTIVFTMENLETNWFVGTSPQFLSWYNSLSATLTFAQTHDCDITEQYVDWDNNINFIFMRDHNSPPPLNNTLIGIITSTLSSWGIKIRHLLRTICWLG